MAKAASKTDKKDKQPPKSSEPRVLVKRLVPPVAGSGNIVVVKSGEELLKNIAYRLGLMQRDQATVELFWDKIMTDTTYNETKEFPDHNKMVQRWELKEGVKLPGQFRAKMRRFEIFAAHFKPGHDYELTVDELVEILT